MSSSKKEKIHVLQVVPLGTGGITSLVLNIAANLDNDRVEFDYLTFREQKEFNEDRALSYGGKKIVIPLNRFKNPVSRAWYKFFGTTKILKKEQVDILHINASFPYDVLVGISAKRAGVKKVVFHSHNSNMKDRGSLRSIVMMSFKRIIPRVSDCNLTCSVMAAEFMFPDSIIKNRNFSTVKNGIVSEKYIFSQAVRNEYRKKLGLEDRLIVGHIGRFVKQKNHIRVIDIFEKVYEKNPDAVMLLIGEGDLQNDIKSVVEKKNLTDAVIFYGATSEVPQLLQAMDVFLFPSLFEGLPVVGIEVQAAGLPILMSDKITREVGITDLADYMSLDESDEAWANKLLVKSRTERKNRQQEIIDAGFDIRDVTDRLMDIYEDLMFRERG